MADMGTQDGHSPWKLPTAFLFVSSSLRLMSDSWMGTCSQRGGAGSLGPWGPEGRCTGPTPPHHSPYLGVLHQAGHGLPFSTSTCLVEPEGAERKTACLLGPLAKSQATSGGC